MGERVSINTERYQLLQEPGLRPPSLRLTYASTAFQKHVVECFGGQLPWLRFNEQGLPFFEHRDKENRETVILAAKATSMAEIPRSESLRLLKGWMRLQVLAHSPDLGDAEKGMMSTFLLPDPETDLRNYRLYTPLPPEHGKRLHVLWGFSTKAGNRTAIPAEAAIAKLLGVAVEELPGIASTSIDPGVYKAWAETYGFA